MNIISSTKALLNTFFEDAQLARLGAPRGALLRLHYGGRWAIRQHRAPSIHRMQFRENGRAVDIELTAPYEGAFKGIFLDQEYQCATKLSPHPLRIVDLGANIGMGSIHLSTQFPHAEFLCVEPDPRNQSLLQRNLRANSVRANIVNAAVGAKAGHLKLRFGDNPTCSALESSPMHDLQNLTAVNVITMQQLLSDAGWETVDLLKIDIEGTEEELLSQSNRWLERVGALIMEIHPNTTPERIGGYLNSFGFELIRLGSGREPVYLATRVPKV